MNKFKRLPQHIGVIPDGNRRWARVRGFEKQDGYKFGIQPGFQIYNSCLELGIKEITFYGFTVDNTKRPAAQIKAFQKACVEAVEGLAHRDADLLVVGNTQSKMFPKELLQYSKRVRFGKNLIKVNFLVNYGWDWDLNYFVENGDVYSNTKLIDGIASSDISRLNLIIRWGGGRRLSGFLPIQSIYADIYVLEEMWPDYETAQFYKALEWYQEQDMTLGG
jgi:undecaprenyl diphosphate synthase